MSVFLGVTYYDVTTDQRDVGDRFFAIQWNVAFFSYMSMIALPAFVLEKQTVTKEVTNGNYVLIEYVLTGGLLQFLVVAICAVIAAAGPFWFPELNPDIDRYVLYSMILAVHLFVCESVAVLVASIIPNFVIGIIVYCVVISQAPCHLRFRGQT